MRLCLQVERLQETITAKEAALKGSLREGVATRDDISKMVTEVHIAAGEGSSPFPHPIPHPILRCNRGCFHHHEPDVWE